MKLLAFVLTLLLATPALAGPRFTRGTAIQGSGWAHIQVWNPVGSGVICTLIMLVISGSAQGLVVAVDPSSLNTYWGNGINLTLPSITGRFGESGKCEVRTEVGPERTLGQLINMNFNDVVVIPVSIPIPPGTGMTIRSGNSGTLLRMGASWEEQ